MEKDSVFTGIILGILTPVIGYMVVVGIFQTLSHFNIMDYSAASLSTKSQRTVALLAICFSLIPFHITKKNYWNDSMRGIVFPTLVYVGAWVYVYKDGLF